MVYARRCKYTPNVGVIRHPRHRFVNLLYPPYHPRNRYFQAALDSCRLFRDNNTVPFIPLVHRRPRSTDEARGTRDLTRACQCASAVHQTKNGERGRLARVVSGEVCGPPRVQVVSLESARARRFLRDFHLKPDLGENGVVLTLCPSTLTAP